MSTREDIAEKRWCPFTRATWAQASDEGGWKGTDHPVGFNRALIRPGSNKDWVGGCLGAECMAWRTTGVVELPEHLATDLPIEEQAKRKIRVGYCGLAGAPGLTDREALAASFLPPAVPAEQAEGASR